VDSSTRIVAVSLVVVGAALAGVAAISRDTPRHVEIVASGEVRARVRRCGCQGVPKGPPTKLKPVFGTCSCKSIAMPPGTPLDLGGFPERSAFLATIGGEPLLVDAGDLF
jgi:hypothetical protein